MSLKNKADVPYDGIAGLMYVPLDTKIYNLDNNQFAISGAKVTLHGTHSNIYLWNRGGYAGVFTILERDVDEFLENLHLVPK